jgi:hypothetical protein
MLKGTVLRFFASGFLHESVTPSPRDRFKVFQKFARYWQVKVHHRQQQICHQYTQGLLGADSWKKKSKIS